MHIDDIRDMTDQQLREQLAELREERFWLKFRSATMELENPMLLSALRRDIARVRTVQRERRLEASWARDRTAEEAS